MAGMTESEAAFRRTIITEKAFLQQVKDLAKLREWRTYHALHSKGSTAGFPDLICLKTAIRLIPSNCAISEVVKSSLFSVMCSC